MSQGPTCCEWRPLPVGRAGNVEPSGHHLLPPGVDGGQGYSVINHDWQTNTEDIEKSQYITWIYMVDILNNKHDHRAMYGTTVLCMVNSNDNKLTKQCSIVKQ